MTGKHWVERGGGSAKDLERGIEPGTPYTNHESIAADLT